MILQKRFLYFVLLFTLLAGSTLNSQERDRSKIPDKYKWNTSDVYRTDDNWKVAKEQFLKAYPRIEKFKGTLGRSANDLLNCLETSANLTKDFARLAVYAGLTSDQDMRDSKYTAIRQEIGQIGSDFGAKTAFIEPEILKMDRATIDSFIKKEKGLETYRLQLDDILRRKAHTGTEGEEKIIADAGLMSGAAGNIYGVFANSEFPYDSITLTDGKTVKLDQSGYSIYRTLPDREDRKKVFSAYFKKLDEYRRTIGMQLSEKVKKDIFYMKARNYGSCLENSLDANNIPVKVYHSLVDNVNANIPTFHRYLNLRKRMMGLDQLHYYDLYAPLVRGVDLKYTVEEAESNIIESFRTLGDEYIKVVEKAFNDRWIDFFPTEGKRSGAYSNGGAYDVHPYMLLNYNGKYDDMSALAHELGHTMHSYLSNKNQPYATSDYPTFVAEVASTFNEALLIDHVLKQVKDDNVRLSILGNYLEGIKGTLFRQTQFAEFELRIHEMAEKGEPLTGDRLNDVYLEITRRYYGQDKGVCTVDDEMKSEWSYIHHFFGYTYYVYQYATAFTASCALSEKVLAGVEMTKKKYVTFLSSGGSDYPIDLLKKAGVDMTTREPFDLTMRKMNRVIDEMEKILDRMKK